MVAFGSVRVVTCCRQLGQITLLGVGPTGDDMLLQLKWKQRYMCIVKALSDVNLNLELSEGLRAVAAIAALANEKPHLKYPCKHYIISPG